MSLKKLVEDLYPLSPMQEGMLFHTLAAPGTGVYCVHFSLDLLGELDADALRYAWQTVVDRHPVLRTFFTWEKTARPLQMVRRPFPVTIREEDLRALDAEAQEARVQAYLEADRARGFELSRPPLVRLALFRTGERSHRLVWGHHHILMDGWSLPLVLQEISRVYEARVRGRQAELEGVRPFREYIDWLTRQDMGAAEAFWRETLRGFGHRTPLELDLRPDAPAGEVQLRLDEEQTARVTAFARQHALTLNTLVQAAWALMLARYSGERDVVFAGTVSGRPPEIDGVEGMVGLFINTLPVRVTVDAAAPLVPWLQSLHETQTRARDFGYAPLGQVQRWAGLPAREGIADSLVVFENYPAEEELRGDEAPTLRLVQRDSAERQSYAVVMVAAPGRELSLTITHAAGFAPAAVERMLELARTYLVAMADHPGASLGTLPSVSEAERQRVAGWNATDRAYDLSTPLHGYVEAQVRRTPEAVAVVFEGETLSYAELDARANRLARHLRKRGVGVETRVGVAMERSLELVVSLLAVLKAGGAYVPIDPGYPADRIAYMLADSGVTVVLTQRRIELPPHGAQRVCVDEEWGEVEAESASALGVEVSADALAYMIYTSGSTGRPKGAMNAHRGIVNRLLWMQEAYGLGAADGVLQKTPFSFDVSVWEFFWPLMTGARLVVARPEGHRDPVYLSRLIESEGVTTLHFVPPMLQAFLEAGEGERWGSVRRVMCSGEALPYELQGRFYAAMPHAELHNLYGPTEAAVDVTYWACERDGARGTVPIGGPVANTRVYVLDERMEPVPSGVAGELYLGGVQVGRGYLGRPGLTAEKFVPDAFGEAGARLYRTGDRVKRAADGMIEYLGRIDFQVKIRGFRIEPGEIEARLREHPAVREAVVVAREDTPGSRRLVAYLAGDGVEVDALRAALAKRLPEYMVPAAFVVLQALPLSPNGKVDRRALPAPEAPTAEGERYVAPRTEAEATLAGIWAELLGVERVGVHDNFFALGGDSILSIQVVSRARRAGLEVTPRHLFEHPTVARLALAAGRGTRVEAEQGIVTGAQPLTPVQQWFFSLDARDPHHWNLPVLVETRTPLDPVLLSGALERLVAHHDALRTRFVRGPEGWMAEVAAPDEPVALETVDLAGLPAEALTEHSARVQASLSLGGPLLRAAYFQRGADRPGRLLLAAHHLVMDHVSWQVVLEDLELAYGQLAAGEAVALPPKTTSFRAWAERLARHAREGGFDAELPFWTDPARGQAAPLPVDVAGGANTEGSEGTVTHALTPAETRSLLTDVPAAYSAQVGDALLAALGRALNGWTGGEVALVEVEGHGREEIFPEVDLSRTAGWFTTLFPVLLDLRHARGEGDALMAVKEQLRALPGRGLGYGALRYLGSPEARAALAELPRAQVLFNYLGQVEAGAAPHGTFAAATESAGADRNPLALRTHLLEVEGRIADGRLELSVSYGGVHRRETVEALAGAIVAELRAIIAHCAAPDAGAYTPSDFPLAGIDQATLELLEDDLLGDAGLLDEEEDFAY